MLTELEAGSSENPFFTQLVQEQPLEHEVRAVFGRLPASAPLHQVATEHRPYPGTSGETLIYSMPESRMPLPDRGERSADLEADLFPFRASARAVLRAPAAVPPSLVEEQAARDAAAIPVVLSGLISATPTGSINLQLRKQLDR